MTSNGIFQMKEVGGRFIKGAATVLKVNALTRS